MKNFVFDRAALHRMSSDELRDFNRVIVGILKARRADEAAKYCMGDTVTFIARGLRYTGTVWKINRATITVNCNGGRIWRVSPNLLKKVEQKIKA